MALFQTAIIYTAIFFSLYVILFYLTTFLENSGQTRSPKSKRFPKLSMILPAHNEGDVITTTLKHVLKADYPNKEIIVIDDGSTDNTYEIVKGFAKNGVKIYRKPQGGKASAINFGMKKVTGEIVMVLDADSFPEKNALKNMSGFFENPNVMAVIPTLRAWRPRNILEKLQDIEYVISSFTRTIIHMLNSLSVVPGAPMIRKSFIDKYGGYDENNLTEDFEMGLRIRSNGYDVVHAIDGIVYTVVPNTIKKLARQRIRWEYGLMWNLNKYRFMLGAKYGDVGIFFLPLMWFSITFTAFLFMYWAGVTLSGFLESIQRLALIDYNISYNFFFAKTEIWLDSLLNERIFFLFILFALGLYYFFLAKKRIETKLNLQYLIYVFVYPWILLLFRVIGITRFLIRRKPQW